MDCHKVDDTESSIDLDGFRIFPIRRLLIGCADQVKKIQNGNIRFYLLLIFVTLILTLWIAL